MNTQARPDGDLQKVYGRTLGQALRNVRARWGEQARIVATRTVVRAGTDGRGENRLVEVTVAEPPAPAVEPPAVPRRRRDLPRVLQRLRDDVERLERLAETLRRERDAAAGETDADRPADRHPLADALLRRGASPAAVRRLADLWRAERGGQGDAAAARRHLESLIRAGGGTWRDLRGQHLFLGAPGAGRSGLVLGAARELARRERRTLVLLPGVRHEADVVRLRDAAAADGFDAAVLRDAAGLPAALQRVRGYDVVLVDGPAVGPGAPVTPLDPDELARLDLHRHLVVPLDGDPAGRPALWEEARRWACDWIAVSRLDAAARPGQLLDLLLGAPLPVSLLRRGPGAGAVGLAGAEVLATFLLGGARRAADAAADRAAGVAEVTA